MALLDIRELSVAFGGLAAVNNVSLRLNDSSILGIIGPNGAGKTTLFNLISGFLKPTSGEILWMGKKITGLKPHKIASLGLTRTFQANVVYGDGTVMENIVRSQYLNYQGKLIQGILNTRSYRNDEETMVNRAQQIIEFMELEDWASTLAKALPHGMQRKLGLAMAMACDPKVIILDEPAAGMNPTDSAQLMKKIRQICDTGISVMLVEHDMKVVMGVCEHIIVLNYGQKIAEGSPEEIQQNQEVIDAYLGSGEIA